MTNATLEQKAEMITVECYNPDCRKKIRICPDYSKPGEYGGYCISECGHYFCGKECLNNHLQD